MDIIVNINKIKHTKDEEPSVMDNYNNEVIKAPDYFKLFRCNKKFFNYQDGTYKQGCMENSKGKYWSEMYDTVTDYNDRNHTSFSNAKIREAINQVILEEQAEVNSLTVDMFSSQRNESDKIFNKVTNLTKMT